MSGYLSLGTKQKKWKKTLVFVSVHHSMCVFSELQWIERQLVKKTKQATEVYFGPCQTSVREQFAVVTQLQDNILKLGNYCKKAPPLDVWQW